MKTKTTRTKTPKTPTPSKTPKRKRAAAFPLLRTDANGFFMCEARYTQRDPTRGT